MQLFERKLTRYSVEGVDWIHLAPEESKTGPCDQADEPSGSTKGGQFFVLLNGYHLMHIVQSDS